MEKCKNGAWENGKLINGQLNKCINGKMNKMKRWRKWKWEDVK